jgi:hypothetical protein
VVQVLHSPQKLECPPFWNGCSYGIKNLSSGKQSRLKMALQVTERTFLIHGVKYSTLGLPNPGLLII